MKEWEGLSCKIQIAKDGIKLFFTAKRVLSVDDHHITFIDKFNQPYTFNRDLVIEIKPLEGMT